LGAYALLTMLSWASRRSKLYGLIGGLLGGGVVGGIGWHIVDPPQWVVVAIEAVLLTVAILLLAIPHSPKLLILTQLAN